MVTGPEEAGDGMSIYDSVQLYKQDRQSTLASTKETCWGLVTCAWNMLPKVQLTTKVCWLIMLRHDMDIMAINKNLGPACHKKRKFCLDMLPFSMQCEICDRPWLCKGACLPRSHKKKFWRAPHLHKQKYWL